MVIAALIGESKGPHPTPAPFPANGAPLCALAAACPAIANRFKKPAARMPKKHARIVFDHVSPAAHGFIVGVLLAKSSGRIWVLAHDLKAQESLSHELSTWWGETIFFPEREEQQIEGGMPDEETQAERLALLQRIAHQPAVTEVIVMNVASLGESVPRPLALEDQMLRFHAGDIIDLAALTDKLDTAGYDRVPQAAERGHYAVRGGILDIYSWQAELPLRIELYDREIESLRQFDPDSQISVGRITEGLIMLSAIEAAGEHCTMEECIAPGDIVIAVAVDDCPRANYWITEDADSAIGEGVEDFSAACHGEPVGSFDAGDFVLQQHRRQEFADQLCRWAAADWSVCMFFNNEGEIERFRELMAGEGMEAQHVEPLLGSLTRGFTVPAARLAVLCDAEVFGRYQHNRARRLITAQRRQRQRKAPLDLSDIADGDYVVHQEHGIGRYRGLIKKENAAGLDEDVVVIEYADHAKFYAPLQQAWLISRYVGLGKKTPVLSSLGDGKWAKTRKQAERSIFEYAEKLLEIQAARDTGKGYAHPPDNKWQHEFENSFIYRETVDQIKAIDESKHDMESAQPMDRLICGDVGFGKTEVAIRTAFKAVMSGKQVAILAPTTVLSQQHYHNFRERMSDYPIRVDVMNRFRTVSEQRKVLEALANGDVDIVVGTHRLISKDVIFKDLGLVVIDEEQRFGVKHKERFKDLFHGVDVLTLSATPIPRTLYMALMGARDMSTIETPPANRTPVETIICGYDERVIKKAIEREIKRKGQVFFLHNRVGNIERIAEKLIALSPPGTKIDVGHGQMGEGQLEEVMERFVAGLTDVLVCTTIIESGIDIPNANTIIIDRADRFGLADLYQLRGRVGRAGHKAYAYLMIPKSEMTGGDARKRINAMKQYTALGSGFKIAMRDLEIRGAGNLLGTQQSGHIVAVGFEMYCQMLKVSVAKIQGKRVVGRVETLVAIDFIAFNEAAFLASRGERIPAYISAHYIPEASQRIPAYRQLAEITNMKELSGLITQWKDRFGKPPPEVEALLRCTELKLQAYRAGCSSVEIKDLKVMLLRKNDYILINGKFPRLSEHKSLEERLIEALGLLRQL